MANNTMSELNKYEAEADDLQARVAELTKFGQLRDEFSALEVSLATERRELSAEILELDGNPDQLVDRLDRIDKNLRLNGASTSALQEKIASREKYLHERLPMSLRAFGTLRDFVSFSVLETCRGQVRSLIAEGYHVEDSIIDSLAVVMAPFVAISRVKLPPISWAFTRPLDEKPPVPFSSLVRAFTAEEWAAQRAEIVTAIISVTNALCEAGRALIVAAGPFAQGCPAFKCEPVIVAPPEAHPEWNEPLISPSERLRQVVAEAGREWESLTPADQKILADSESANKSYLATRPWMGPVATEGEQP